MQLQKEITSFPDHMYFPAYETADFSKCSFEAEITLQAAVNKS